MKGKILWLPCDLCSPPTHPTCPSHLGFAGLPETRTDTAMSELVPEPRPKPAVPMKPVSINSNLLGYIGIDTIIEQMRKKTMKTGFDFNIMVVGMKPWGHWRAWWQVALRIPFLSPEWPQPWLL